MTKGVGVVALLVVLDQAGHGRRSPRLHRPLLVAGTGMDMVFVPLFDILAGVNDHEVGSASGILQALQQLGMSLGVAGVGTLFGFLLPKHAREAAYWMAPAQPAIPS